MEKVMCALWRPSGRDRAQFSAALISELAPELTRAGASRVRVNVQDETVASGAALRQVASDPQQDAVLQYWLPSANDIFRAEIDGIVARYVEKFAAWLVVESTIIPNADHPPVRGERTWGFAQLAFLPRPTRLSYEEWRTIWQSSHTRVAIDTQSNFEYVQNLIVRPLTEGAPEFAAIVEECFPLAALTDPHAFFDAVGDTAKFEANLAAMMASCDRFIDQGAIDVLITSQYDFG